MPHERRVFGDVGERLAERLLSGRGWRVFERNAQTRYGEIDLVCLDGGSYVFVEVKTRRSSSFVSAVEAVDPRKVARVARLGEAWLSLHGRRGASWRIAVVAVTVGPAGTDVRLLDPIA